MALETELKKNTAAMERLAAVLEAQNESSNAGAAAAAPADSGKAEEADQAPAESKSTGKGKSTKASAKKSGKPAKAEQAEASEDAGSGDDEPVDFIDPKQVRKAIGDYLSQHEGEAQQERKKAIREYLDTLQNEDGERPSNAADLCAEHRPLLLAELEKIKERFDGEGSEDEDGDDV